MPTIASDIMASAAALCNDVNQRRFTNAALLPYMKKAYRELESHLDVNGIRTLDEVSADILVPAGTLTMSTPSDLVSPYALFERTPDSTETWTPMTEQRWEPDETLTTYLRFWVWREDTIQFLGATVNREVRVRYKKSLTPITSENSSIGVKGSESFLEDRVAALAAKFIGENLTRAKELDFEAEMAKQELIRKGVKSQQGRSVRRQRYGSSWRAARS